VRTHKESSKKELKIMSKNWKKYYFESKASRGRVENGEGIEKRGTAQMSAAFPQKCRHHNKVRN
jgi:hypothetical protein